MVTLNHLLDSKNFSFKCHRDESKNVFSVNAISFHPMYGTFSTAGSDGTVSFWDKDSKQRLKPFSNVNGTIPCTTFNRNGTIFAYAISYDWSKVNVMSLEYVASVLLILRIRDINSLYPPIPTRSSFMPFVMMMSSHVSPESDKSWICSFILPVSHIYSPYFAQNHNI